MTVQIIAPAGAERGLVAAREVDLPGPVGDQVAVTVRAVGVNPTDWKSADATWPRTEPLVLGFEAAGVVAALGPDARGLRVGEAVIAYPVLGAYASRLLVPASDLHRKPAALDFPRAANLLLAATTAAQMLHVTGVGRGDTVVVHGGSSAVGVSVLQQLRLLGARAVATASERSADLVRSFGAEVVAYGPGLADRLRAAASSGFTAALDCVGTDEALETSLELVADRARTVTIANRQRAPELGIPFIDGVSPESLAYRNAQRLRLVDLAASRRLTVPLARTFPLTAAADALDLLRTRHPGGKMALTP